MTDLVHGTRRAYRLGCRCPQCRENDAKAQRYYRKTKRADWGSPRICVKCGNSFVPKKRNQHYCSRECQQSHVRPDAHGTNVNYGRGCRCDACTSAHTVYHRRYLNTRERERECVLCGSTFTTHLVLQKYCSIECRRRVADAARREAYRARMLPQICPMCGIEFAPGFGKGANRKYCSYKCKVRARRLARYAIVAHEFRELVLHQEGKCAICGAPISVFESHCDHDHEQGQVRGVLCRNCNIGIGHFHENPEALHAAAAYLERT